MANQRMRLSIGVKISMTFALIVMFFIGLALCTTHNVDHSRNLFIESSQVIGETQSAIAQTQISLLELDIVSARLAQQPYDSLLRYKFVHTLAVAHSLLLSLQQTTILLPDSIGQKAIPLYEAMQSQLELYENLQKSLVNVIALNDATARAEMLGYSSQFSALRLNSTKIAGQLSEYNSLLTAIHDSQNKTVEALLSQAKRQFVQFGILFVALLIALSFISVYFIIKPIRSINKPLSLMGKGVLPITPLAEGSDELGRMAANLNVLVEGLQKISLFANEMGKGNFDSKFEPLSDKDTLGNALIRMREELKAASEEEAKRKEEDQHRNWASQGIARFSEILRENNNNLEALSFNVVSNLVKYVGANQGGLFIINESNPEEAVIEISACYAYDRKKFTKKSYGMGEGLIGRCVQEQESIFLTEIPKGYTEISSGLGNDDPTCLFIVPLKANENVLGAIELAAFNVIEPYQIEFIEKIAESIASTIATVKINIQTKQLLEQSRRQAEDMASQEQEMRQNMEQLRATQELSARKEAELLKKIEALKS